VATNDLFVATNGLFVATNGLFVATNGLFVATNGLFVATNDLFVATNDLFAATKNFYAAPRQPSAGAYASCVIKGKEGAEGGLFHRLAEGDVLLVRRRGLKILFDNSVRVFYNRA
jgi:Tfp pilus assembly protein PilZ